MRENYYQRFCPPPRLVPEPSNLSRSSGVGCGDHLARVTGRTIGSQSLHPISDAYGSRGRTAALKMPCFRAGRLLCLARAHARDPMDQLLVRAAGSVELGTHPVAVKHLLELQFCAPQLRRYRQGKAASAFPRPQDMKTEPALFFLARANRVHWRFLRGDDMPPFFNRFHHLHG